MARIPVARVDLVVDLEAGDVRVVGTMCGHADDAVVCRRGHDPPRDAEAETDVLTPVEGGRLLGRGPHRVAGGKYESCEALARPVRRAGPRIDLADRRVRAVPAQLLDAVLVEAAVPDETAHHRAG